MQAAFDEQLAQGVWLLNVRNPDCAGRAREEGAKPYCEKKLFFYVS
jgi:hypothetical protein